MEYWNEQLNTNIFSYFMSIVELATDHDNTANRKQWINLLWVKKYGRPRIFG